VLTALSGNKKQHFLCIFFKSGRNSLFSLAGDRIRFPTLLTGSRLVGANSKEEKTRRRNKVGNVFSSMAFSQLDNFSGFRYPRHDSKPSARGKSMLQERIGGFVIRSHHRSAGFLLF